MPFLNFCREASCVSIRGSCRRLRARTNGATANSIFLVEHQGGYCCCRLHYEKIDRITLLPTQLPFANVEFRLGARLESSVPLTWSSGSGRSGNNAYSTLRLARNCSGPSASLDARAVSRNYD